MPTQKDELQIKLAELTLEMQRLTAKHRTDVSSILSLMITAVVSSLTLALASENIFWLGLGLSATLCCLLYINQHLEPQFTRRTDELKRRIQELNRQFY